jgi:hypothetical protein
MEIIVFGIGIGRNVGFDIGIGRNVGFDIGIGTFEAVTIG